MADTVNPRRGEIYYVTFQDNTVGSVQRSGRPAVIVSSNTNNMHSEVLEVCYLTLKDKPKLPTHVFVEKGACNNSTILCEQITSVSVLQLGDYVCRLPDELMEQVDKALTTSLGIEYLSADNSAPKSEKPKEVVSKHSDDSAEDFKKCLDHSTSLLKEAEIRASVYEKLYNELLDKVMRRNV